VLHKLGVIFGLNIILFEGEKSCLRGLLCLRFSGWICSFVAYEVVQEIRLNLCLFVGMTLKVSITDVGGIAMKFKFSLMKDFMY